MGSLQCGYDVENIGLDKKLMVWEVGILTYCASKWWLAVNSVSCFDVFA